MHINTSSKYQFGKDNNVFIAPNWGEEGVLSIVIQGGLLESNAAETAAHCQHWRDLFPKAEIILSVSSSDFIDMDALRASGVLKVARLMRQKSLLTSAAKTISAQCDRIVAAEEALPLPPIKSDSPKLNNCNLQIAAAQAGLAAATGRYVLRIRSDLVFLDRFFLNAYAEGQAYGRGQFQAFPERILISNLFTINPYTVERLPFHFSDWFNLGTLESVRDLWAAPYVSLKDATHFECFPHPDGSFASERLFNTRLAVEQHIAFSCFKRHFPNLVLEYINDLTCVEESMAILRDNFIITNIPSVRGRMPKYAPEARQYKQSYVNIFEDDWRAIAETPFIPAGLLLTERVTEAHAPAVFGATQSFPRRFKPNQLYGKISRHINGQLVAIEPFGVALFGPHCAVPQGNYIARVHVTTAERTSGQPGAVRVCVTSDCGAVTLSDKVFYPKTSTGGQFDVLFSVKEALARDVEVVCHLDGMREFAVSSVEIIDLSSSQAAQDQDIALESLTLQNGVLENGVIKATERKGRVFYGPYATMRGGSYVLRADTAAAQRGGTTTWRLMLDGGARVIRELRWPIAGGPQRVDIAFTIPDSLSDNFEVLCDVHDVEGFRLEKLTVVARNAEADRAGAPVTVGDSGVVTQTVRALLNRLSR